MSDTQWPTFEVFQQSKPEKPHTSVGAVHAPDAEMALLNARDIFVRRPNCFNLWVVPTDKILAKTAQELEDKAWLKQAIANEQATASEAYYVFQKQTQKATEMYVTYVGQVEAPSPLRALEQALKTFTSTKKKPWVWWVCPARFVTRSQDDDIESMFEPALDKPYRHQNYYHTVTQMHKLKHKD